MKKNILRILVLTQLLMAFQCDEDEIVDGQIFNNFKVRISEGSDFSTGDTIWLDGRVSSRVFDEATGDSIVFQEYNLNDFLSVLKLKEAENNNGNSIDALDHFTIIDAIGETSSSGYFCENSELNITSSLSNDGESFQYRIGLIPNLIGDYVLSWNFESTILNENRNLMIIDNYPVEGYERALDFNKCGSRSTLPNVNNSERELFFTIQ